jgi:alpha-tubulin suppressor-like RCC1 family protein
VWDWGLNSFGMLGIGVATIWGNSASDTNDRDVPVEVMGPGGIGFLSNIISIMGSEAHNVAIRNDGTVWAWGWNKYNQLGDGTTNDKYYPVQVPIITNVVQLGGRAETSIAIDTNGNVWTWGNNDYGQIGNSCTTQGFVPYEVPGVNDPIMVGSCNACCYALLQNHTMVAWGGSPYGDLGDGLSSISYTPVAVQGLSNIIYFSAGWDNCIALRSDGTAWIWGENYWNGTGGPGGGLLGQGTGSNYNALSPVLYPVSNLIDVSCGDSFTAVLRADGTVWCSGCNLIGQCGNGITNEEDTPVMVPGLSNVIMVNARDHHCIAITSDGTVWEWGSDYEGECGTGQTNSTGYLTPVRAEFPAYSFQ